MHSWLTSFQQVQQQVCFATNIRPRFHVEGGRPPRAPVRTDGAAHSLCGTLDASNGTDREDVADKAVAASHFAPPDWFIFGRLDAILDTIPFCQHHVRRRLEAIAALSSYILPQRDLNRPAGPLQLRHPTGGHLYTPRSDVGDPELSLAPCPISFRYSTDHVFVFFSQIVTMQA